MKKLSLIVIVCLLVSAVAALPAFAQYAPDPTCPGSLPSRLNAGDRGEIAEVFSTLRYTPNGASIQVIYAPAQFTVLSKLCDGYTWSLQIQYDSGLTGWAIESQVGRRRMAAITTGWNPPVVTPPPIRRYHSPIRPTEPAPARHRLSSPLAISATSRRSSARSVMRPADYRSKSMYAPANLPSD